MAFSHIAVVLLAGCALYAQDTGRLSGSVTDPSGAVVPGAKVELFLPGGDRAVLTGATTSEGLFHFVAVRPDFYDLVVVGAGFRKYTARQVKIDPGRETSLPAVKLELGTVAETIEVTVGTSGVQTTNAEISTTITNEQVKRLPVFDRNPLQLVLTQPGVHTGRSTTTINGLRTSFA
ncbi:MAG: carboxypeptidase-like regulatory domain-containing protein, partial [Bryobacteraceae bacterium]